MIYFIAKQTDKGMKKYLVITLMALLSFQGEAQTIVSNDYQKLQVRFSVGDVRMEEVMLDGRTFTALTAEGCMPSAEVGAPNLPTFSALIEVPLCEGFEVRVSEAVYDTLTVKGAQVVPVQPSRSKSDRGHYALVMDGKIYAADAFYGVEPARVEAVGVARDRNLARLQFSPMRYNPVTGKVIVCRSAVVTVNYAGANVKATEEMHEKYYSPVFASGMMTLNTLGAKAVRTAAPIRYLIVAHSSFRGQMDGFVQWKRRKGFITDIVYTDDAGVGTTSTAIANYVKSQYTNATAASPAPTYLLIVGDHEQIPAFASRVTSPSSDHITDLYYVSWTTGDNIPDCYCGRFSAQSVSQLTPQIEKTLMYEQYTFSDPSFLDRAVMVAGVDGGSSGDYGYTRADPAMDYAIVNYVNGAHGFSQVKYFKNNTSIVPAGSNVTVGSSASSNSATVRDCYNEGAGWINYSAHGSATSWGTPNFTTSHAASMTNVQKFGVMVGNCCLTNKFETATCLGESVLRKGNYCGAVGYIGGSNSTYWNEDFYWAVGLRSGISATMSMAYNASNLGVYDRAFHTHNEAYSNWAKTQGEMMMMGNMAVESSTSNYKIYYWEIYHLMGDPSLMPYFTQASQMDVAMASSIPAGTTTLTVTAAPYAYVALTDTTTRTLRASGYANASGVVTLALPSGMPVGGYEVAASAQQYRTAFRTLAVVPAQGAYAQVTAITPQGSLTAGATVQMAVKVVNLGNSIAHNVNVALSSGNAGLTFGNSIITISSIAAGDSVTRMVTATVGTQVVDGAAVQVTANATWNGSSTPASNVFSFALKAPHITVGFDNNNPTLLPGTSLNVAVTLTNSGHAALGSSQLTLVSSNSQLSVTPASSSSFTLAAGATVTRQFTLHASSSMDMDVAVPLTMQLTGPVALTETIEAYVGENTIETFEGGNYVVQGWEQGTYPWVLVSDEAQQGSYCARSYQSLGHNQTSELSITVAVARTDSISFYYKVSSESNYDKFHFYIDNEEKVVNSGVVDWTRVVYAVAPGSHTFKFTYSKDGSVNSNSDCAWIDNVSLPRTLPHYNVTVTATHGTATGSGTYQQGETAVVGVYPEAGYSFVQWSDGSTANPRQVTVMGNIQLTASLSQGGVIAVHDTTVVIQHDTMTLIQTDTVTQIVYDTVSLVQRDTMVVYEQVTVHDTLMVHDTVDRIVYEDVLDTMYIHDTSYVNVYVHDTTYIDVYHTDTAFVDVYVHDTTFVDVYVHDTAFVDVYVHDTTLMTDTVTVFDTVTQWSYDTVDRIVFDTTIVIDTLWLHDTVYIHDTVYVMVEGIDGAAMIDVKIYQQDGSIVVDGAEGYPVSLFDAIGRKIESIEVAPAIPVKLKTTSSGVYLVKIGMLPARRVVVIK